MVLLCGVGMLEGFVGFFGGELLGGLDGEADGMLVRLSIDEHADIVLGTVVVTLIEGALDLERDFDVLLLIEVDELAFIVPVGLGESVDVYL